jgi:hypothetical protein
MPEETDAQTTITFGLFDARYTSDPDRAVLYTTEDTLKEARKEKRNSFTDAVIVRMTIFKNEVIQSEIVE